MTNGIPDEEVADLFLQWVEMTAKIEFCGGNELFGGLKFLWDYAQEKDLSYLVEEYACVFAQEYHYMYRNGLEERLSLSYLRKELLSGAEEAHVLEKSTDEIYKTVDFWKSADKERYETLLANIRRGLLHELLEKMKGRDTESKGRVGFDPEAILNDLKRVLDWIKSSGNPPADSTDHRSSSNSHGTSRSYSSSEIPDPAHESNPASSDFRSKYTRDDHHWK